MIKKKKVKSLIQLHKEGNLKAFKERIKYDHKHCDTCGDYLSVRLFGNRKKNKDGLRKTCKSCCLKFSPLELVKSRTNPSQYSFYENLLAVEKELKKELAALEEELAALKSLKEFYKNNGFKWHHGSKAKPTTYNRGND